MAQRLTRGSTLRAALAVALFLALAAAGAGLQNGNAAPSTKLYTTLIGQDAAVAKGAAYTAHVTLTNSTSSSQTLGSENVVLPLGFGATAGAAVTAYTATGGASSKHWNAVTLGSQTLSDGTHAVIQLRATTNQDAIAPGEYVKADVSVSVPCTLPADTTWRTQAKQSNSFSGPPGNDFLSTVGTYDSSTQLWTNPYTTTTSSATACTFRFVSAAALPTLTDWTPDSSGYRAGTKFAVAIEAVDGSGNQRTGYSGPATMSGLASTHGTPKYGDGDTGSHSITFTNGLASFNVTTYTAQFGTPPPAALTVTDQADPSITKTSPVFNVYPGAPAALKIGNTTTPDTGVIPDGVVATALDPAVKVNVYDAYGNLENCGAPCSQLNVALKIVTDAGYDASMTPAATQLGGGGSATSSNGTVTYSGVTFDRSGAGFTLQAYAVDSGGNALSPPIVSQVSDTFTIYDADCSYADPYSTCTASRGGTTITTDYPTPTLDPTLLQLSASGQSLNCGASTTAIGALVTFAPAKGDTSSTTYDWKNPIQVTLRWDKPLVPGTGVSNFTLCLAKPFDSPWGSAGQYSVVQDCPSKLTAKTVLPCASKRSRDNAGDLVIVLLLGSGDPIAGLG